MSPVGHSLIGATVGVALWPQFEGRKQRLVVLLGMIAAANIPDLPLPFWGHTSYRVSHSVFSGLVVATIIFLAMQASPLGRNRRKLNMVFWAATLALVSHYLLDTLYNHGKGLPMFWPFSDVRVALPIPWFAHMDGVNVLSWHNLQIGLVELAAFGTLSLMVLALVLPWQRRRDCEAAGKT